ncbi:protein of unknown function [Tepidibacter aestuarii]|nr:protein of unknown function [Tepidibacter aestuarii]
MFLINLELDLSILRVDDEVKNQFRKYIEIIIREDNYEENIINIIIRMLIIKFICMHKGRS